MKSVHSFVMCAVIWVTLTPIAADSVEQDSVMLWELRNLGFTVPDSIPERGWDSFPWGLFVAEYRVSLQVLEEQLFTTRGCDCEVPRVLVNNATEFYAVKPGSCFYECDGPWLRVLNCINPLWPYEGEVCNGESFRLSPKLHRIVLNGHFEAYLPEKLPQDHACVGTRPS